jgi:hypothetical protein
MLNSSIGCVSTDDDNIITAPEYILVEITEGPGKNIQISGLPRGVVPLSPVKFWYNTGHERRVRLEQFALTLAYARTNFKAQGQTMLHGAVLDDQHEGRHHRHRLAFNFRV